MTRIETNASNGSRRAPQAQQQAPAKRPNVLKRIFGSKETRKGKPAKHTKVDRCPTSGNQEMLLI